MTGTDEQISATRREVHTRAIDGRQAHVVRLTRPYETSVEDLWSACTDPERIPRWLLPISGELRLGGRYQLEGNAGGTITRCEPPRRLAASWEYGGSVSWIELVLSPRSAGVTELVLEHCSLVDDDEKWKMFGPGAVGVGWDLMLRGLAGHLTSGAALDRDRVRAWVAGEDGREFMALSARGWMAADIEAGADADHARTTAERTTEFYTGTSAAPPSS
jgi:uncharacterized protein YndB with AHSA1/START domain